MDRKRQFSAVQIQGPRSYQEDKYFYKNIRNKKFSGSLLAVMDGHTGDLVSSLCAKSIGRIFKLDNPDESETALSGLVAGLNDLTSQHEIGSTFSSALILNERNIVSVAILGDSPVFVLDDKGEFHISPEHNVRSNMKEREFVLSRGGVISRGYVFKRGGMRGIQMSRALGDNYLEGVISREPEIYTIERPVWVLVASDGIIDPNHFNSEGAIAEIKKFAEKNSTAEDVMKWALGAGLRDNATALVWRKGS